jgi:hypothetical protein
MTRFRVDIFVFLASFIAAAAIVAAVGCGFGTGFVKALDDPAAVPESPGEAAGIAVAQGAGKVVQEAAEGDWVGALIAAGVVAVGATGAYFKFRKPKTDA